VGTGIVFAPTRKEVVLLGDEAVALAAIHAGVTAAYAYPGTPSTEILEYILTHADVSGRPHAAWCTNEKTAYEAALGVSLVGRRALVAMKHVGLNVAADPFINSVLVAPHGGLVLAVADDPGMHSSQNEQDSRFYADFARTVCFDPATEQDAYDMTREAFDVAERFRIPVVVRLVTRLAHSRAVVCVGDPRDENAAAKPADTSGWILLPANARRQWRAHIEQQRDIEAWAATCRFNTLVDDDQGPASARVGVITAGIARNYYLENVEELDHRPLHLHIGAYPPPRDLLARLVEGVDRVLVLEDGYPLLERALTGLLPDRLGVMVMGRTSGHLPPDGELTPDVVRTALGLAIRPGSALVGWTPPPRPPQLCAGCPHIDTLAALTRALEPYPDHLVTSDIGCYTLGALPPYRAIDSCVCMGASIGMARGASDAGMRPVIALIGDSTFLHSGVTGLIDAVASNTDMTLVIMANEVVAMTGGQTTLLPSSRLAALVAGLGVDPAHSHVLDAHPRKVAENAAVLRREIEYRGLSVVISVRECIETARTRKKQARERQQAGARAACAEVAP
jgi:indolepyruvate ferredoxin oxidoreductase, alpha subunit